MSVTSVIIDPLLHLHGTPAYALVAGLTFAEAALFVGFVLPGETAVILGGVLAFQHAVSLPVMIVVAVAAAIVGDSVGYEVGARYGDRVLTLPMLAKRASAIGQAQQRLRTQGGVVVFLSRFTAFLRAVMPGLAGTAKMPYRRFLFWNAAGGIVWGVGFTLLGFVAGASYRRIESFAGDLSYVVLGLVAVALVVWAVRRHRRDSSDNAPPAAVDSRSS